MKTFWAGPRTGHELEAIRRGLMCRTGVLWTYYGCRGGAQFAPVWTRETPLDAALAARLLPYVPVARQEQDARGGTFVALATTSGLTLAEVLIAAKTLVQAGTVAVEVCRTGDAAKVWRREG